MALARGDKAASLQLAMKAAEVSSIREPAELLADWYETGSGPVERDSVRATEWRGDAIKRHSGMKQFTVPCEFPGLQGRFGTYMYMRDPYKGSDPVEEEFYRVEHYDGAIIPNDVKDGFRTLLQIAIENKLSFTDLTVYALGDASKTPQDQLAGKIEPALVLDR